MKFSINQRIGHWQWAAALVALFLLVSPAQAAIQEMRVLATGVDRSSSKAAAIALEYAKKRAVYLMARKMQVPDANTKVAALKEDQMREIVRGATVLQTRRQGDITYADVSVSIVEEPLRRAMGLEEAPTSQIALENARGVLVLPVFIGRDRPYLWEKENRFSEPLRAEILRQARGAVLVPSGDFDDRRLVDYQNALEVTPEELGPMFSRYGVEEIVIAIATLGAENTEDATMIILRRLSPPPSQPRVEEMVVKPHQTKTTSEERLRDAGAAVAAAVTNIAGSTSQMEQEQLKNSPSVNVRFYYANAQELGEMQEAVRNAEGVLQLVMPAIALENMHGILYLSGDKEAVRKAIVKQGILVTSEGDGWRLSLR